MVIAPTCFPTHLPPLVPVEQPEDIQHPRLVKRNPIPKFDEEDDANWAPAPASVLTPTAIPVPVPTRKEKERLSLILELPHGRDDEDDENDTEDNEDDWTLMPSLRRSRK